MIKISNDTASAPPQNLIKDDDDNNQNAFAAFIQMEELFDKLKLINYENEFVKAYKMRPINRHYFALQTNSGEQFFMFSSLAAWLIQKCEVHMELPQEYDDPNSTIASILNAARNLEIMVDFPPNKLRQGFGKFVILLLNNLCDKALKKLQFSFLKPVPPVEVNDEEIVTEDNSELLLERIEEEMAAEEYDTEDDEDVCLNVDDLNKLNFQNLKVDEFLQSKMTNEEWQLEMERVMPSLKLVIRTDNKDWRSHIEQIKQYRTTIGDSMTSVRTQLDKLTNNIAETMEKINSREKFLNSNLDSALVEYRAVEEQLAKINAKFRELNSGVTQKQKKLTTISEELELVKQEMEERGTIMTDGTPLINIKKALTTLKDDVANMNVQIGILQHDILHSKLREKLLMQQKVHSQKLSSPAKVVEKRCTSKMIPTSPETISATHIEYLPLPAAYLTSIRIDNSCGYRSQENNGDGTNNTLENSDSNVSKKEQLEKISALAMVRPSGNVSTNETAASYFRGCDLHYAPKVPIPAAKSILNMH